MIRMIEDMRKVERCISAGLLCLAVVIISDAQGQNNTAGIISWKRCLSQAPQFYATDEHFLPIIDYPEEWAPGNV